MARASHHQPHRAPQHRIFLLQRADLFLEAGEPLSHVSHSRKPRPDRPHTRKMGVERQFKMIIDYLGAPPPGSTTRVVNPHPNFPCVPARLWGNPEVVSRGGIASGHVRAADSVRPPGPHRIPKISRLRREGNEMGTPAACHDGMVEADVR